MVRVPIAPQVEAQVPQGPSGAPQFQAPPMPGMQESQQLAQDIGRAGQMAMDVQRDEQALALYQQRLEARATAERQATIAARQDEIDKTMLKGAETLFNNRIGEVSDAFKLRKGLAVVPGFSEAESVINTAIEEVEESLPEELRPKWRYQAQMLVLPFRRGMLEHVGKQVDEASRQGADQHIANLGDAAKRLSSSALDPKGDFAVFAGAAMNEIDEVVKRDGYGPNSPQAMKRKREWWSDVSQSITDDMADQGRFEDAMKFVDGVNSAGMLPKEEFDKIRDGLETAEADYSSIQTANRLFFSGEVETLANGDPDVGAMVDMVRESGRPQDWIDKTISRINAFETQRSNDKKDAYSALYESAKDLAWSADAFNRGYPDLDAVPPSVKKQLKRADLDALYNMPLQDNQIAIDTVRQRMAASQIEGGPPFTKKMLEAYRKDMKPSTYDEFRKVFDSPDALREIAADENAFKAVLYEHGINDLVSASGPVDQGRRAMLMVQWKEGIRNFESGVDKSGRPIRASAEDKRTILRDIISNRMFEAGTWRSGFYEMSGSGSDNVPSSGIFAVSTKEERENKYIRVYGGDAGQMFVEADRYAASVRLLNSMRAATTSENVVLAYQQLYGEAPRVSAPAAIGGGAFTGQGFPGSPSENFGTRYVPERPSVAPVDAPPPTGPGSQGLMPNWPFGTSNFWYSK